MRKLLLSVVWMTLVAGARGEIPVKFVGVVEMGEGSIVSLVSTDGLTKWCAVGESFRGYTVREIRAKEQAVVLHGPDKQDVTLQLKWGAIQELAAGKPVPGDSAKGPAAKPTLIPLEQLDWAFIKSDRNPMRKQPESLPDWAYQNWAELSEAVRIDLKNYYREHGWDVEARTIIPGQRYHVRNRPLKDPSEPVLSPEELRKQGKVAGAVRQR